MGMLKQIQIEVVDRKIQEHDFLAGLLVDAHRKIRDGNYFAPELVDIICQTFFGPSIYDAYYFLSMLAEIKNERIACAYVEVGSTPGKDSDIDGNNQKLAKLPAGFKGKFWGGTQDEDGYIDITEPIGLLSFEAGKQIANIEGKIPLEVGYINPCKVAFYMNTPVGRLARWPYYSDKIYILGRVEGGVEITVPYRGRLV